MNQSLMFVLLLLLLDYPCEGLKGKAELTAWLRMLRDISSHLGCHLPALGKPCHLCDCFYEQKEDNKQLQVIKMMFPKLS